VAAVLVLGALVVLIGAVLLFNVAGAGALVMRHVTSKYLGSLPPGYANTQTGFRVYSVLIVSIGVLFIGLGVAAWQVVVGVALLAAGVVGFAVTSVLGIRGEGEVYRRSKR
jgi:hypothetical protein